MPVTDVTNDAEALTMTLTAEFDAPLSRVWQLYADPRQLEKWWNPPGYPLTIVDHDLSVGGFVRAVVISPEGGLRTALYLPYRRQSEKCHQMDTRRFDADAAICKNPPDSCRPALAGRERPGSYNGALTPAEPAL